MDNQISEKTKRTAFKALELKKLEIFGKKLISVRIQLQMSNLLLSPLEFSDEK